MYLQQRLDLLEKLGNYILSDNENWLNALEKAHRENGWFTPEFIKLAFHNISTGFLQRNKLQEWIDQYDFSEETATPKNVGIIMAGNIPLVGFHDFLCVFVSGHRQTIKTSSKDEILIRHLVNIMYGLDGRVQDLVSFADMLKGCDAYIATGSNNSSRYFEYYFGKYAHIIRRNRTSVGILSGDETMKELFKLADDVYQYFGLGCRNVTKVYVPQQYDFVPMLEAFKKYTYLADHNKYRNNYDYQLALLIMNKQYYMTNGSIILHEHSSEFSAISRLNYEFYSDLEKVIPSLAGNKDIQCIMGKGYLPFGTAQYPGLNDYADGVDTMLFLRDL
ncbi:MAG: acyl-CoA reductase [Chitinophagaceae bacterium]|nr:acyl-CoA reductase [Chitinophagaceae bacterium]